MTSLWPGAGGSGPERGSSFFALDDDLDDVLNIVWTSYITRVPSISRELKRLNDDLIKIKCLTYSIITIAYSYEKSVVITESRLAGTTIAQLPREFRSQ